MTDTGKLRAALRGGAPLIGLWATIPSPLTAEVAAAAGADYVVVDQQHGVVGPEQLLAMLVAIRGGGAVPLVRVAREDPWLIGHALDLGAAGVIVPMVQDAAQAARAVAACRYAPAGERSHGRLRDPEPGAEPLCLAMIETRAALEQAEAIAGTPGLDGIYIGPSDLALSFGLQPTRELEHAPVLEAIERIRAIGEQHDLPIGLHCLTAADAARHAPRGFALITAGGDLQYLRAGMTQALATARGS